MALAYEQLPQHVKDDIADLHASHSIQSSFGASMPIEKRLALKAQYPDAEHPVVRTHPETGEKVLFVNSFTTHFVSFKTSARVRVGQDGSPGSGQLLAYLISQAQIPEYQVRFRWQPNSVTIWDNRCTQHYAVMDYPPCVRKMDRAAVIGARAQDGASAGASAGTVLSASGGKTTRATRQANRALRRKVYAALATYKEIDAGDIGISAKGRRTDQRHGSRGVADRHRHRAREGRRECDVGEQQAHRAAAVRPVVRRAHRFDDDRRPDRPFPSAGETVYEATLADRRGAVGTLSRLCIALRLLIRTSESMVANHSHKTPTNTDLSCQT